MDKGYTIGFNMIVKNAEDKVAQCLESLPKGFFDQMVIVDTGSTDSTKEICARYGDVYDYVDEDPIEVEGHTFLGDFAKPRNFALEKTTTDFMFWMDSDDYLWNPQGLIAYLNEHLGRSVEAVAIDYDYDHSADGDCLFRHDRERVIRVGDWVWRSPIHEILCAIVPGYWTKIPGEQCKVLHQPHEEGEKLLKFRRNAAIARRFIERAEGDVEPRMWLNLGNSLIVLEEFDEAIEAYQKYLYGSEWNEERYHVFLSLAECYRNVGNRKRANESIFQAVALFPEYREAYIELGNDAIVEGNYEHALHWAEQAIAAKKDNRRYRCNPMKLEARPHEIRMVALSELRRFEESQEEADEILKKFPAHRGILARKAFVANLIREQEAVKAYQKIENMLSREGVKDKMKALRSAIPDIVAEDPRVRAPFSIPRDRGKPAIAFYCGQGFRTWGHDSIEKGGVGGSETAVIRMTKALADLGWHVEVFGYPEEEQEGLHDGVWWFPYWRLPENENYDVLVSWRTPLVGMPLPRSERAYIWVHDVQDRFNWGATGIWDYFDQAIVLSEAHRKNLDFLDDEQVWISRNGIDASFYEGREVERDPNRMIYASCPSRGLVFLADQWDRIRGEFPRAQIDVFYGFNEAFREAMKRSEYFREVYTRILKFVNEPGVNFYGMVDQKTLGEAFRRAAVWAYPCRFPEISCITAMQAQATGAVPVTTGFWALNETVEYGFKVGGPEDQIADNKALQEAWMSRLFKCLENPKALDLIRKPMIPWAQEHFLWTNVAKEWDQKFRSDLRMRSADSEKAEAVSTAS